MEVNSIEIADGYITPLVKKSLLRSYFRPPIKSWTSWCIWFANCAISSQAVVVRTIHLTPLHSILSVKALSIGEARNERKSKSLGASKVDNLFYTCSKSAAI